MEKNVIITISRQFGSNGREIARKLAEYLDISYYNKEILERIAVNMGVCADFFKDQNQDANGLFTIESKGLLGLRNITELSVNSQIYDMASDFIQKISQREDAVIVGRCADYALEERDDVLSVFIHADMDKRIAAVMARDHINSRLKAKRKIEEIDEKRSTFRKEFTGEEWGQSKYYNLSIDTTHLSYQQAADLILYYKKLAEEAQK